MRRKSAVMAAGLLATVLAGCGGGEDAEPVQQVGPVWTEPDPLPYWPGPPALLRTQAELEAVWAAPLDFPGMSVPLPAQTPKVDFATHALVWVPGSVPDSCHIFGIRKITRRGFDYTIEWGYQDFGGNGVDCLSIASTLLSLALLPQPVSRANFPAPGSLLFRRNRHL